MTAALSNSSAWRFDRFLTRWVAEEVYAKALPAIEAIRGEVEAWLNKPRPVGRLRLNPNLIAPHYWTRGVHLTPGGWDGHDLMGTAIAELIYRHVFLPGGIGAVRTGENLLSQRDQAAMEAPKERYGSIIDLGAGTGRFTLALQRRFPDARVTGVELSATSLRHAYALAGDLNLDIEWLQADAADTGLPEGSADLVTAYALLHEVAPECHEAVLAEAFRLLRPGGDLLISEIAPYEKHSPFRAVVLDWETENRGEPYWRAALQLDLTGALAKVGFVDVEAYGVGGGLYPWITRATKPTTEGKPA